MMPYDSLSGFDEAPTMAMVVASVRSCFSSGSDGFAWAILRAYIASASRPSQHVPDQRRRGRELPKPEQKRPVEYIGAGLADVAADLRQSVSERDADARVHPHHILAQARSNGRKPHFETLSGDGEHVGLHLLERVGEILTGFRSELVAEAKAEVRLYHQFYLSSR